MANKKLYYDKIYDLVMQCRKSGLSDKQWCINNDIAPSTFYWWIKKLRQQACYEIPERSFKCNTNIVTEKTGCCLCKCVTRSNRKHNIVYGNK